MAEIIRMPRMSDTMEEGVLVGWEKNVGDSIEPGDVLAEIETDKATMEFESVYEGVLLHIEVESGTVPIDGIIAVIGEEGEDFKAQLEEAKSSENGSGSSESASDEGANTEETTAVPSTSPEPAPATTTNDDSRVKASPLARSMAADEGVALAEVKGSGDNGRIVKRDIEAYLERKKEQPQPATPPPAPSSTPASEPAPAKEKGPEIPSFSFSASGDNYEEEPVSQMRKTIARRLAESKFSAPHFYLTIEINMDKAIKTRKEINEIAPTKISFNDLVIKAAAAALKHHPAVNSSWLGDKIRRHKDVNIGVAVAVDQGLLVPVVRFADMKTLSQINVEVKDLAGRAKNRKLGLEEMEGNTFTISNLGMFGIEEFTAIINPPDSCILAVGGIIQKPIVEDGEIVPGNMMKVTLSCDHRVVDGATGAQFLQTFKEILEDPIRLLV